MKFLPSIICAAMLATGVPAAAPLAAQNASQGVQAPRQASDADLIDLADYADLVVRAKVRRQSEVEPERAPGLRPGYARFYIEAETLGLIAGSTSLGERVNYLVDLPLDARGRKPKLRKEEVLLFARPVAGRPSQLQLVAPDAQLLWDEGLERRTRLILEQLVAPGAAPKIVGIRDALSVAGTLAGESETQIFLETVDNSPAAISVVRRPNMAPVWGVSFSEIVDQAVRVPETGSLAYYRLSCALPRSLPSEANLAREPADRARASDDYRYVLSQLGQCERLREAPTLPY
ncbi:hypothetical protein [Alteriqipengyuania lutimaris]|uniref:Uncharacterized protein n=1 Tax=Alteriqipengyuania lutimaris TaxID=1538146 RepID=A0A395LP79_9SPHN|nr:hypothetical protein [Alteriqipengyuania lutimaris]MBB3034500.1 hypothetical protein [Alteriqipengyuania lutimaris]RDS78509.1 hypothetical protein DL238_02655 [Alteriqipengyuania lutimaris]